MDKIIISCPNCDTKLRVPDKKHIKFKCTSCGTEIDYDGEAALDVKEVEDKEFKPSNWRIGAHVIIGALIGAPVGSMVVACVASIYGSFKGLFTGFPGTIRHGFDMWDFLAGSVNNIGVGAAQVACDWTIWGAKIGPWVFAALGLLMSMNKWEDSADESSSQVEPKSE